MQIKSHIDKPGRKPTSLVSLAKKWKEEGEKAELSKKQLHEVYKLMLNTSTRNIEKIANNKDTPFAISITAKSLLDPKTRAKTFVDIQTLVWGKAPEEVIVHNNDNVSQALLDEIKGKLDGQY